MELTQSSLTETVTLLACDGRLNMISAPKLKSAIAGAVSDGSVRIIVDLGGVQFIDSSGLGALVAGLKASRQAGGDLRIAAKTEQVLSVLKLTNLDRILRPYPNVSDATREW